MNLWSCPYGEVHESVLGKCKLTCFSLHRAIDILSSGCQVKNYARVADSIIGWGSSIGRWGRIENKSVVGEDVHIKVSISRLLIFT